jgi:hypothetical protein
MGGAGGHMAHLSEDLTLKFSEIIEILADVAHAELEVTEKVDGQNLFLTVDSTGAIRTARNDTDIAKGGMTPEEYASKWSGHPAESAFMYGFEAIGKALDHSSYEDLQDIFDGGKRWLNMEIMYPGNPNIINYGAAYVVLHNLNSDEPEAQEAFQKLVDNVDSAQIEVANENWTVYGPAVIALNNIANGTAHQKANQEIEAIASQAGGLDASVGDYAKIRYKNAAISAGLTDELIVDALIDIVFKTYTAEDYTTADRKQDYAALKKRTPKSFHKVLSTFGTKTKSKKIIALVLRPLERVISDFAIEALRGLQSFFVVDHNKTMEEMKDELEDSITKLEVIAASGDENIGALLDRQLEKLGNRHENLASSLEGVVFKRDGKIFKLTGSFAMVNQLIGKARRAPDSTSIEVSETYIREAVRATLVTLLY